jgi:hypothetical protein
VFSFQARPARVFGSSPTLCMLRTDRVVAYPLFDKGSVKLISILIVHWLIQECATGNSNRASSRAGQDTEVGGNISTYQNHECKAK